MMNAIARRQRDKSGLHHHRLEPLGLVSADDLDRKAIIGDQGMEESAAAAVSASADWVLVSVNNVDNVPNAAMTPADAVAAAISLATRS